MTGMVALGFGFLFMQRMNEEDGIYEAVEHHVAGPANEEQREPPAMVDLDEEEAQEEDDLEFEEFEELEEEEDLEIELVDDTEAAEEVEEDLPEPVVAEKAQEKPRVQEKPKPQKKHSGLLDTGEGFALRLPRDAVDNILASLDSTPHEGYVPVVAFGPNGQIMLTFESDSSTS